MKKISVIVPCYNEEDVIENFYEELKDVLSKIKDYTFELLFINDGSKDKTLDLLKRMKVNNMNMRIVSFSRNFGKEAAIYAGLENSTGDLVVVMDADLQHPPKKILEMISGIEERF